MSSHEVSAGSLGTDLSDAFKRLAPTGDYQIGEKYPESVAEPGSVHVRFSTGTGRHLVVSIPSRVVGPLVATELLALEVTEYLELRGPSTRFVKLITLLAGEHRIWLRELNGLAAAENSKRIQRLLADVSNIVASETRSPSIMVHTDTTNGLFSVVLENAEIKGQVVALRADAFSDDVRSVDARTVATTFLALHGAGSSHVIVLSDVLTYVRVIATLEKMHGFCVRIRRWPANVTAADARAGGRISEEEGVLYLAEDRRSIRIEVPSKQPEPESPMLGLILRGRDGFELSDYKLASVGDLDVTLENDIESVAIGVPARRTYLA